MKALACLLGSLCLLSACKKEPAASTGSLPFTDDFNRKELGVNWFPSGGDWKLRDGYVYTTFSNNMPYDKIKRVMWSILIAKVRGEPEQSV